MTPIHLHARLMEACEKGTLEDVKACLDLGIDPNFNINRPANALDKAIQRDEVQIITLLLERGAIIKEYVLQRAIERDKAYLNLLLPNFRECKDQNLLMGVLQGAISIGDTALAKQAIDLGAEVRSLLLYAVVELSSVEILALLIDNGFDIHMEKNALLSEWLGSSPLGYTLKPGKLELLSFVCKHYLGKPESIERFDSLGPAYKSRLFLVGLGNNNVIMMKFALAIGVDKSEALNNALRQYHAYQKGDISATQPIAYPNNPKGVFDYEIIEHLLNSKMAFSKITISNAVSFHYMDVLDALEHMHDLEYGYELAYKREDDALCEYFTLRGVCDSSQTRARMKVSALKGNIKELHKAIHEGANIQEVDTEMIVQVMDENQVESLRCLYDSGVIFDAALNQHLDKAMRHYKAYEAIAYLIESGLDITSIKNMPREFVKKYPVCADMWQKRFGDIFEYVIYLVKEVHPKAEGKEKEEILSRIAALSSLPYVIKKSEEQSHAD